MLRVLSKTALSLSFVVAAASVPQLLSAQAVPQGDARPALTRADIPAFAKVEVDIGKVRDSIQAQLAQARNKKDNVQAELRARMHTEVEAILKQNNLTDADYEKKTFAVSTDAGLRAAFDSTVAKLTGQPLPTYNMSSVPSQAETAIKLPPGAVGVHIGHVIQAFGDTPKGQGLLPTAIAEAKIAAQHAEIASKNTSNLDAMKLHAGHVINAIDPTIQKTGPGLGYGVKKATQGVITHIQLAAKAPGASNNVITHAGHVVVSAQNTLERCDQAIALAQKIQASTSASDAAALVSQLVSVTQQLYAGVDANNDGRITWDKGEGGLQQADEHMQMMIKGEGGR